MKVLSVDDCLSIRRLLRRFLEPLGLEVIEAENGHDGIEAARREKPDLIILDMNMPLLDGRQTLAKIRDDPATKDIPVVMLTADAGEELVMSLIKAGITYYIVKPFDPDFLVGKVCQILNLSRADGRTEIIPQVAEKKIPTILVADDNETILLAAKKFLAGIARVIATQCPFKAIQLASEYLPQAVLLDLGVPNVDTTSEVFKIMVADPRFKGSRFVAMATATMRSEIEAARQAGFHDLLLKPFDRAALVNLVLTVNPGASWDQASTSETRGTDSESGNPTEIDNGFRQPLAL